jgi:hypothetical protein
VKLKIKIDKDVPIPKGRSTSSGGDQNELTEMIQSLEPGDSFFLPASEFGTDERVLQRRMTVKAVSMRKSGRISFFMRTEQKTESWEDSDGVVHAPEPGVRIWRRLAADTEVGEVDLDAVAEESSAA